MSFRGEVFGLPIHISEAVSHFKDLQLSYDWIDLLKTITDLGPRSRVLKSLKSDDIRHISGVNPFSSAESEPHIIYQRISLPWPVSDRELVMEVK